ncbi:hypothetical protein TRIATDRAFT_255165, partial [Trichoderma atroviride IMI 206040]
MRLPLQDMTPSSKLYSSNSSSSSNRSSTWEWPMHRWLGLITVHTRMAISRLCPLLMPPTACTVPHLRIYAEPRARARAWNSGLIRTHTTRRRMRI